MLKMFISSLKIKLRDKTSLFYALIFPLIFLTVFGIFDMDRQGEVNVLVIDSIKNPLSQGIVKSFKEIKELKISETDNKNEALAQIKNDEKDVIFELKNISSNETAPPKIEISAIYKKANLQDAKIALSILSGISAEMNIKINEIPKIFEVKEEVLEEREIKYFDFIFPGILGMGVMMYTIMGAGIYLARYRELLIFKRLFVTPFKRRNFFLAETLAYQLIASLQITIIILLSLYVFKAHMYGNLPLVFALVLFGNLIFVNLGFIISSFAKSSNAAEGLANIIAMPMMFLSGTFFAIDLLPKSVQSVVQYLPLTALLDALREVMLSGSSIDKIGREILILVAWFLVTYAYLIKFYKFKEE